MKTTHLLGSVALIATAVLTGALPLQDARPGPGAGAPSNGAQPGDHDMDAIMAAFRQAAVPGPQHKDFARCVGTWTTHFKHWADPSQPPQEGAGTSSFETIMGGRFLVEHAAGDGPLGPFEGMGLMAYDNVSHEYQHVWLDDMSTGLCFVRGIEGPAGSVTLKGDMVDPVTQEKVPLRVIATTLNENERRIEMFCSKNGKEQKSMEITYTRGSTAAR